jgi:NAD(P)-dependent dehydrogenase (short-subunit alcohol dehydrogenase family)
MTNSSIALITGGSRGLGRETARRLAELGWTVWLGSRDLEAGEKAASELQDEHPDADVRVVQLDVTDDESISRAARVVGDASRRLDVLVNNAGISGRHVSPQQTTPADFVGVYGVNVLGPVRVTNTFLPLLRRSAAPRLVMVSSGMGSFAVTGDPNRIESALVGLVYPSSKAALNMVTTMYSKALDDVRVTAVDPGYTSTAFNNFSGSQTVAEGTDAIIQACTADSLPATFIDRRGALAW